MPEKTNSLTGVAGEHYVCAELADPDKITHAIVQGVRTALLKHKQAGNPIVIWRDGKTAGVFLYRPSRVNS